MKSITFHNQKVSPLFYFNAIISPMKTYKVFQKTFILFLSISQLLYAESFDVQGSDLLMGVGSKNIATAGASTASSDDLYAIFYNPAGLSEIASAQLALSAQADAKLGYVNFIGMAYAFELEELALKVSVAFAYIPRLYIRTSGTYVEDDFESIFLRYTLPDLSPNFTGDIDSKTDDYRFAVAFAPLYNPSWSFGVSVAYVNCATTFAGVTLEKPENFTYMSTVAKATAFGIGAKYYINEDLKIGMSLKNLDAKLSVETEITDDDGNRVKTYDVDFPYDLSFGMDYKYDESFTFAADYQEVYGNYGDFDIDFKMLRFGTTFSTEMLDYHMGVIAPLRLYSSKVENLDLPYPVTPTAGLGWHGDGIDLSMAFYIHPIMSLHLAKPSPSLDLSLKYDF